MILLMNVEYPKNESDAAILMLSSQMCTNRYVIDSKRKKIFPK